MCLHWLKAAAIKDKRVSLFVDLYSFSIILNLSIHTIGTLLHGHSSGATGLGLESEGGNEFSSSSA